jgi:copper chaperone
MYSQKGINMTKFSVPKMSCGHCKSAIENAIKAADGGAQVDFDMAKREVTVSSDVEAGILISSINAGGYEAQVI